MGITNGIYTELTFEDALANIINDAPASIVFSPGNPPELVLANMFGVMRRHAENRGAVGFFFYLGFLFFGRFFCG